MGSISGSIRKVYRRALTRHPEGIRSYGWWYGREQAARFDQLLAVADGGPAHRGQTLLDVGCGRGDLLEYLVRRGLRGIAYTGVDLMPEFIELARHRYPHARFFTAEFLNWRAPARYDYVVASGALSVRLTNNERYLGRLVAKMLRLARRGVAFNFLTTYHRRQLRRWCYYDPGEVLRWCVRNRGVRQVRLSVGYDPFDRFGDATVILSKR